MITTDCRACGDGPMDLPGDEICDDCRIEMRNEDPAAFEDDLDEWDEEDAAYWLEPGEVWS